MIQGSYRTREVFPCEASVVLPMDENEFISGFKTYGESYKHKQHLIQEVANKFNEDCELFDVSVDDIENDNMNSAWDLVAL